MRFLLRLLLGRQSIRNHLTSDEIGKTGHAAVYGIHFDTGKATILLDSENTLGEIVKLLQQNSDLRLRVEGHPDNQGNATSNQALSARR
jgi:OOP family OmpA-OmpF porin